MFSNYFVNSLRSKFHVIALYSTSVTPNTANNCKKYLITSLFKKKDEPLNLKYELVKAADVDSTVQFLEMNFLREDPLCRSLCLNTSKGKYDGPIQTLMRDSLHQGMSIVAREENEKEIVGACINSRNCPWDAQKLEEFAKNVEDESTRKLLYIWALMSREPRLHQELNLNSIFEINVVAIKRKHAGKGIGTEIVRQSLNLACDLNFAYARMDCTSDYSMKIAKKLNMKRLWDVSYRNILMQDGKTPLAMPEHPHSHAAVYYMYLK